MRLRIELVSSFDGDADISAEELVAAIEEVCSDQNMYITIDRDSIEELSAE